MDSSQSIPDRAHWHLKQLSVCFKPPLFHGWNGVLGTLIGFSLYPKPNSLLTPLGLKVCWSYHLFTVLRIPRLFTSSAIFCGPSLTSLPWLSPQQLGPLSCSVVLCKTVVLVESHSPYLHCCRWMCQEKNTRLCWLVSHFKFSSTLRPAAWLGHSLSYFLASSLSSNLHYQLFKWCCFL